MRIPRFALIILLGVCITSTFCSCSSMLTTYTIRKAYPGPELRGDNRQALILRESGGGSFISCVDGQDTTENGERLAAYGVLLLPGTHDLEIRFHKSNVYMNGHFYDLYSKGPVVLPVNLVGGHSYSLKTTVEPFEKSKKLYKWEPYLQDITGEPGFILAEAPRRPYQFSLSAPNSKASYIIQTPGPDKWVMHRRAEKSDFPVALTFYRFTGKLLKTSSEVISVVLDEHDISPRNDVIDEVWISKFLMEFVFREWAPRELPIDILSRQLMQVGGREYYEVLCQSVFRDAMDNKSHSFFRMYIPKPAIPEEPSPIFVMVFGKKKDFNEKGIETVIDMITTMRHITSTAAPNIE